MDSRGGKTVSNPGRHRQHTPGDVGFNFIGLSGKRVPAGFADCSGPLVVVGRAPQAEASAPRLGRPALALPALSNEDFEVKLGNRNNVQYAGEFTVASSTASPSSSSQSILSPSA